MASVAGDSGTDDDMRRLVSAKVGVLVPAANRMVCESSAHILREYFFGRMLTRLSCSCSMSALACSLRFPP